MTGTTIAAGEIREWGNSFFAEARFWPCDFEYIYAQATVPLRGNQSPNIHIVGASLTPAEARDFARAILAAADWAERQRR